MFVNFINGLKDSQFVASAQRANVAVTPGERSDKFVLFYCDLKGPVNSYSVLKVVSNRGA